jgi:molybdopterin-binding protein
VDGRAVRVVSAEPVGRAVRLAIQPDDVLLALPDAPPSRSSARNVLPAKVVDVTVGPRGVRVVVDCGFPLVALVTARSLAELRLRPGAGVDAVFKASAVHVLPL